MILNISPYKYGGLKIISGNTILTQKNNGILTAVGGCCGLVAFMGIGRFAFTALLPGMMDFYGFEGAVAGAIGSLNFAGYLTGVMLARKEKPGPRRYYLFVVFMLCSLLATTGMGLAREIYMLYIIRFFAGFSTGMCFVLASSIVLDTLNAIKRPVLSGIFYSGTGIGIATSGLAAGPLQAIGGSPAGWLGLAAIGVPLAGAAMFALRPGRNYPPPLPAAASAASAAQNKAGAKKFKLLVLSYFLEGFGYIIGATFIVAFVQEVTSSPEIARASWIMTGIAAAVSVPIWKILSERKGYLPMLILAFLMQATGALLPVLSSTAIAALGGGLLLGGTFMGITTLSLQYGVLLSGKPSASTVALLSALFGIGQVIGPMVAGGMGFYIAFVISAVSMLAAAGILIAASFIKEQ